MLFCKIVIVFKMYTVSYKKNPKLLAFLEQEGIVEAFEREVLTRKGLQIPYTPDNIAGVIVSAFGWSASIEGFDFWAAKSARFVKYFQKPFYPKPWHKDL